MLVKLLKSNDYSALLQRYGGGTTSAEEAFTRLCSNVFQINFREG